MLFEGDGALLQKKGGGVQGNLVADSAAVDEGEGVMPISCGIEVEIEDSGLFFELVIGEFEAGEGAGEPEFADS